MIPEKIKNNMKELDCVEVTAEREKYAKEGVHRGMQGWNCDAHSKNASWLVNFPQCGEKPDIATLVVKACDLKCIPVMNAVSMKRSKCNLRIVLTKERTGVDNATLVLWNVKCYGFVASSGFPSRVFQYFCSWKVSDWASSRSRMRVLESR